MEIKLTNAKFCVQRAVFNMNSYYNNYFCYLTGLAMQQASKNVEHNYHNCVLRFVDIQLWRHFKYSYFNMAKLEVAKFNR